VQQEAKFLASLSHPNIIKLRGMAAAGTSGFASMKERGYFLLLDRLQCTLEHKIDHWRNFESAIDMDGKKGAFLAERLHVAFDVAAALSYLHGHNILYRDLKPDNIGFDVRGKLMFSIQWQLLDSIESLIFHQFSCSSSRINTGDVKIFDFGLAKELDPSLRHGCTEFYELSGNTGSLRYMSPEVARCEPYNLTADVYSFGLLLWQVCSLMLPYDGMNRQDHSELVVYGNERPPLDSSWSTPLRILMKRAWEPDPSVRPSMDSIYKILRREICSLRSGDDTGLEHYSRRSTFVLNRDSAVNNQQSELDKVNIRGAPPRGLPVASRRNLVGQASQRALQTSQRGGMIPPGSQRGPLLRQTSGRGAIFRQGSQRGPLLRQGSQVGGNGIPSCSQRGDSTQFGLNVTNLPPFALDRKTSDTAMAV
jgi:serine/threonine protein kinase